MDKGTVSLYISLDLSAQKGWELKQNDTLEAKLQKEPNQRAAPYTQVVTS